MYKSMIHKITILVSIMMCIFTLAACSQPQEQVKQETQGGFVKIAPGAYDSADTALVIAKQENKKKITFLNLEKKKNYTLNYDGTTKFMDKYGSQISVSQLAEGEMVDLLFLKDEKMLSSLTVSSEIWTLNDVNKFELDLSAGRMKILDEDYILDENTVVISNGELKEFMDINVQDILQIKGIDHKVYSITIQEGHGYLRLKNDEYFVGGWIEVGQKIIQKIEEDMLLPIPEGTYEVYLSHSGIEGTKEVKITRNTETVLDVGDLKKDDLIKYGNLIFTVDPSGAEVFLDGKKIDTTRVVKAEYGLHQIMAKAEGYDTVIQYIRVNENNANVAISLDEETVRTVSDNTTNADTSTDNNSTTNSTETQNTTTDSDEKEEEDKEQTSSTTTDNTVSDNDTAGSSTGYKITIESPKGVEVYFDGNYVGISPVSFKKKKGSHEIILRKSGYETRSYTIYEEEDQKDSSYSFSELTAIE